MSTPTTAAQLLSQIRAQSGGEQQQPQELPSFQPAREVRSFTESAGEVVIDVFQDILDPLRRIPQAIAFTARNPRVLLPGAVNDPAFVKAVGELDDKEFEAITGGMIDIGIIAASTVLTPAAGAFGARLASSRVGSRVASNVLREGTLGATFGALAPDRNEASNIAGRLKDAGIGAVFGGTLGAITGRASALKKLAKATERQTLLQLAGKSVDDVAEILVPEHAGAITSTAREMLEQLSKKEMATLFQAEAVAKTGTLQDKAARKVFAKVFGDAVDPADLAVNPEIINAMRGQFIAAASNFRGVLKKLTLEAGDPLARKQAQKAVDTLKTSIDLFLKSRKVAGQSLQSFNNFQAGVKGLQTAGQEALAIGAAGGNRPAIFREFVTKFQEEGLSNAVASEALRGSLQLWRRSIFPVFSFARDGLTNSFALGSEIAQDFSEDMFRFAAGRAFDFSKTRGTISALRSFKDIFRNRAGSQIEKIVVPTALGEKFRPFFGERVDRIAFIPLNLKAYVDTSARRLAAMSSLYDDGGRLAKRFGLRGSERKEFIQNFVFKDANQTLINKAFQQAEQQIGKAGLVKRLAPKLQNKLTREAEKAFVKAQEKAGRVGFTRELSNFEESIANNAAVQLLVTPFPRWNFQFTRFMVEHSPASAKFWKDVAAGKLTGEEIARFTTRMLGGAGGVMAVNNLIYDDVDFDSMNYVDPDDGSRVSLLGATPLPELLFISAMFRGDADRAFAAFKESSVVFGPLLEENGILTGVMDAVTSLGDGADATVTVKRMTDQFGRALVAGFPGASVAKVLERIVDPIQRTGILRDVPGLSQFESPLIDITTGEPREQTIKSGGLIASIEEYFGLTTGAGEPLDLGIPFIAKPPNLLENAMRNNNINPFGVGSGTKFLEAEAKDIPVALRNEFREIFGKLWAQVGNQLIKSSGFKELGDGSPVQRDIMLQVMRNLLDTAKVQINAKPENRKIWIENLRKHYENQFGPEAEPVNPRGLPRLDRRTTK